jgi:UrcA family protein
MSLNRMAAILPAACLAFALAPAFASEADSAGIHVSLRDLDLNTSSGLNALYSRIHIAAKHYCDAVQTETGSRIRRSGDACVKDAIDVTVRKINLPALTALYRAKNTEGGRG